MAAVAQVVCATKLLAQLLPRLLIPSLLARAGRRQAVLEITEITLFLTPLQPTVAVVVVRFRRESQGALAAAAGTAEVPGAPQRRGIAAGLLALEMPVAQAPTMDQVIPVAAAVEPGLRVEMEISVSQATVETVGSTT